MSAKIQETPRGKNPLRGLISALSENSTTLEVIEMYDFLSSKRNAEEEYQERFADQLSQGEAKGTISSG